MKFYIVLGVILFLFSCKNETSTETLTETSIENTSDNIDENPSNITGNDSSVISENRFGLPDNYITKSSYYNNFSKDQSKTNPNSVFVPQKDLDYLYSVDDSGGTQIIIINYLSNEVRSHHASFEVISTELEPYIREIRSSYNGVLVDIPYQEKFSNQMKQVEFIIHVFDINGNLIDSEPVSLDIYYLPNVGYANSFNVVYAISPDGLPINMTSEIQSFHSNYAISIESLTSNAVSSVNFQEIGNYRADLTFKQDLSEGIYKDLIVVERDYPDVGILYDYYPIITEVINGFNIGRMYSESGYDTNFVTNSNLHQTGSWKAIDIPDWLDVDSSSGELGDRVILRYLGGYVKDTYNIADVKFELEGSDEVFIHRVSQPDLPFYVYIDKLHTIFTEVDEGIHSEYKFDIRIPDINYSTYEISFNQDWITLTEERVYKSHHYYIINIDTSKIVNGDNEAIMKFEMTKDGISGTVESKFLAFGNERFLDIEKNTFKISKYINNGRLSTKIKMSNNSEVTWKVSSEYDWIEFKQTEGKSLGEDVSEIQFSINENAIPEDINFVRIAVETFYLDQTVLGYIWLYIDDL